MSIDRDLHMAGRAKDVVENEAYIAAFEAIKQELTDAWKSSPARDVEGRERLWLMQMLLGKLEVTLRATMDAGKLAKAELIHKQTLRERAKDWLR